MGGTVLVWGIELVTKVIDQKMPITGVSRAWQYAAAPIGAGLAAVVGIDEMVEMWRGRNDPDSTAGAVNAASILSSGTD